MSWIGISIFKVNEMRGTPISQILTSQLVLIYSRRIMQFPNPSESVINIILCAIRNSHGAWIAAFASFRASLQVADPYRGKHNLSHDG